VRQEPKFDHDAGPSFVTIGTRILVRWPGLASSILDGARAQFLQVADNYTWVNPHLALTIEWSRASDPVRKEIVATALGWRKWRPSDPTSPHWYDVGRLGRLIAAHIVHAEDHGQPCLTVREFVSEFRGLSGTAKPKAICDAVGASRVSLAQFYGDGTGTHIAALLAQMCKHSRPIKPKELGAIGKEHFAAKFEALDVAPETFDYRRAEFEHDGLPYLAEVAFGYCPNSADARRIVTGVNWSVSIGDDPFGTLGPLARASMAF
jgi:hypothetical protein